MVGSAHQQHVAAGPWLSRPRWLRGFVLRIVGNNREVAAAWAAHRWPDTNGPPAWGEHRSLYIERDGVILAAVIYNNFSRIGCDMHVAAEEGRAWLTKSFLRNVFAYPFEQMGFLRVTAKIGANNLKAKRFLEHLGFSHEGTHPDGWAQGVSLLSYGLLKEHCRFLGANNGKA